MRALLIFLISAPLWAQWPINPGIGGTGGSGGGGGALPTQFSTNGTTTLTGSGTSVLDMSAAGAQLKGSVFSATHGFVNVLAYGADPTGVASSTAAFAAAQVVSNRIYIPNGTYSGAFVCAINDVFYGESVASTILQTSSGNLISSSGATVHDCRLENLTLNVLSGGHSAIALTPATLLARTVLVNVLVSSAVPGYPVITMTSGEIDNSSITHLTINHYNNTVPTINVVGGVMSENKIQASITNNTSSTSWAMLFSGGNGGSSIYNSIDLELEIPNGGGLRLESQTSPSVSVRAYDATTIVNPTLSIGKSATGGNTSWATISNSYLPWATGSAIPDVWLDFPHVDLTTILNSNISWLNANGDNVSIIDSIITHRVAASYQELYSQSYSPSFTLGGTDTGMTDLVIQQGSPASIGYAGATTFSQAGVQLMTMRNTAGGVIGFGGANPYDTSLAKINASTGVGYFSGLSLTGNLLFTDNTYDIGASGATRPRNGYYSGRGVFGGAVSNGVTTATNSDNRGHITLSVGTGSYTFTQGPGTAGIWTTAPVCIIQDDTTMANIATSAKTVSTSTLTITGSVGTGDTYSYICLPGN